MSGLNASCFPYMISFPILELSIHSTGGLLRAKHSARFWASKVRKIAGLYPQSLKIVKQVVVR